MALQKASTTAATQLVSLLMSEHQLMARLASVKHYFLLDQGDFFIHFLDSAEAELTKPVGEISRARLQAKLDIALRQSAVADPYRESLTCGLLPYNLTNQLLRIINASKTASAAPPPPQAAASSSAVVPKTPSQHLEDGNRLSREKAFAAALESYNASLLPHDPPFRDRALIYRNRCFCLFSLKRYDEAIADDLQYLVLTKQYRAPTETPGIVKALMMKWHLLCAPEWAPGQG